MDVAPRLVFERFAGPTLHQVSKRTRKGGEAVSRQPAPSSARRGAICAAGGCLALGERAGSTGALSATSRKSCERRLELRAGVDAGRRRPSALGRGPGIRQPGRDLWPRVPRPAAARPARPAQRHRCPGGSAEARAIPVRSGWRPSSDRRSGATLTAPAPRAASATALRSVSTEAEPEIGRVACTRPSTASRPPATGFRPARSSSTTVGRVRDHDPRRREEQRHRRRNRPPGAAQANCR